MKLISCHIENFGNIKKRDIAFNTELTSFCEKNGYGKSTIAAFLKSMFYGMDSTRKNGKFNDRVHYFPFSGGVFGGSVVFLCNDKIYKIERFFDETSDTRDKLNVYCNNEKYDNPDYNIGEKLFGINKESFERTIFITSAEIEFSSTDSINTKLNNFVAGCEDDTSLFSAIERLEKKKKEYKKQKQGAGLIDDVTQKINKLKEKIANYKTISEGLPAKYLSLNTIEKRLNSLIEKYNNAQEINIMISHWEQYDSFLAEINDIQLRIDAIEKKYIFGIPSNEELERISANLDEIEKCKTLIDRKVFSDEDKKVFSDLKDEFINGVPTVSEVEQVRQDIDELRKNKYELDTFENKTDTEAEKKLRRSFSAHEPTQSEIVSLKEQTEAYSRADEVYKATPEKIIKSNNEKKSLPTNKRAKLLISICAIIAVLIGVALLFVNSIVGTIICIISMIVLIVVNLLYNKESGDNYISSFSEIDNPEKQINKINRDKIANNIGAIIMAYGYSFSEENDLTFTVSAFLNDYNSYKELKNSDEKRTEIINKYNEKIEELRNSIQLFFNKYGLNDADFIKCLTTLQTNIARYNDLEKRTEKAEKLDQETKKVLEQAKSDLSKLCIKYKLDESNIKVTLKMIQNDISDLAYDKQSLNKKRDNAKKYKAEKELNVRPNDDVVDLTKLNDEIQTLQEEKQKIILNIADDERDIERYDELQNELFEQEEILNKIKREYDLLTKTVDYLNAADRIIKDKYVKPVRDIFVKYSNAIEYAFGEKVVMDPNFNVRFEQNGVERSEAYLSSGQKGVCAFCFRLALLENMYSKEKPFLILDDPFVFLDEQNHQKIKELLNSLAAYFQIIYFTCHTSRKI